MGGGGTEVRPKSECGFLLIKEHQSTMTEESRREFKDEEVEAIADLVENLSFEDDGNLQLPQGMTMERAVLILAWQQKQATAAVFATLDEAFGSD